METIKTQIKNVLETIKPDKLKDVIIETHDKDPLDMDIPSYPVAFVGPGAIVENTYHDNYTYELLVAHDVSVLMKAENFSTMTEIEALMFDIAFLFMQREVLGGNCLWVKPTTSAPTSFQHKNRQLVEFTIKLEVRNLVSIASS